MGLNYVITAQVSPVTYQVDMPEKRKRHRTFHVNMLKQWNSPVASVLAVCTEQLEESDGQLWWGMQHLKAWSQSDVHSTMLGAVDFVRSDKQMLDGLDEFAAGFIDDMVIFSMVWSEHLTHLRTMLSRLKYDGLTAKARKCMQSCVFLGHVVGEGCVRP